MLRAFLPVILFILGGVASALDMPEAAMERAQTTVGPHENLLEESFRPVGFVSGHLVQPAISVLDGLSDLDGRATTDVRPEELGDSVQRELRQRRCRFMGSGLDVDFGQADGGSQLYRPLNLLVECPERTQFRFIILQSGIPANYAQVELIDNAGDPTQAHLSFTTVEGLPLGKAVYVSDGQPRTISLIAHLTPASGDSSFEGEIHLSSPLEITLVVD